MKWIIFFLISTQAFSLTLTSKSKYTYMNDTAIAAECVLYNSHYQHEVSQIPSFDYSDMNGEEVVEAMLVDKEVFFTTYKSKWRWSKTIAYTDGSGWVFFNRRKNPRSLKSMVNTAIHEASHVVGFGHGDNSSQGKQDSVPYKIGKIAEKYADGCAP